MPASRSRVWWLAEISVRATVLLIGLLLTTAAVAGGALDVRTIPGESWVGSQLGWTSSPPSRCKPRADVCSTDDGGATWQGIFNGGSLVFGVVRTSATAGAVSTGKQASARFWTRDNGRHWYRTACIGPEFQGSGKYLFWIDFGPTLHRVMPWPPRGKATCRGAWVGAAFETAPARGGNVCSGAAVEAGMRSVDAVTLEEGKLATLANVPGGIVAGITGSTVPRVLLYRLGRPRVVDLPSSGDLKPCTGFGAEPLVSWPRIAVPGCGQGNRPAVMWLSENGGVSWQLISF